MCGVPLPMGWRSRAARTMEGVAAMSTSARPGSVAPPAGSPDDAAPRPLTVLAYARSTSGFYFGEMLAGLTRELAGSGGRVVIVQTLDPDDVAFVVRQSPRFRVPVAWDHVDGVVAMSLAADAGLLADLQREGKPLVLTHEVEGISAPLVLPDNRRSVRAAVDHLRAHGHTAIGFVGSLHQADLRERYEAYRELVDAGLVESSVFIETEDYTEDAGRRAAACLAAADPRPTAVVVAADRNALGLLEALPEHGIRVPRDLAVVSLDNVEAGAFSSPTLSSVGLLFDQVGVLAAQRLRAAIAGGPTASSDPAPTRPTSAFVAARGSCGCVPDAFDGAGTGPAATVPEPLRDQLTALLRDGVAFGATLAEPDVVRAALAAIEQVTDAGAPTTAELGALLSLLTHLATRPDQLHRVVNALSEHLQRADAASAGDVPAFGTALWRLQAGSYLRRSETQERLLTEQFRIAAELLSSATDDPRTLTWLAGTHVRAGVLALWDGTPGRRLTIVGAYDPEQALPAYVGTIVPAQSFPPRGIIDLARPDASEACFVVPVQTDEHEWGLLALVGGIMTTSSQDTYHHWAALLCAAFEAERLEQARRASEERYALAARAAHDGLWEVDLVTSELHAAARFLELVGAPADARLTPRGFLDLVHPDDAGPVDDALRRARQVPDVPVEVEFRVRHGAGWRWLMTRGLGVAEPAGEVVRLVGSVSDVHARKELEDQLRHGALHDPVTGLANRRLFLERLGRTLQQSDRRPASTYAVIFLDLDGFKLVNDSLGHLAGDQLLTVVADRLRTDLRSVDTAARLGGDEFAVLLSDPVPDEVLAIARRIQERIAEPVVLGGHDVVVTASVGIATSESGYQDPEDVLRDADIAMYEAKAAERGSASVFDPEMHARATSRLRARSEVRTAVDQHQFEVHYQPIVALDGSAIGHFEALVRWRHPERGLLFPGDFLPAMQETSAIVSLGRWILDEVCRQVAEWAGAGLTAVVAVNVSHKEFWSRDLVADVADALTRHGVPARQLILEITESVIMTDCDAARAVMAELHALGVRLHIDDFGTGTSTLTMLREFPVDALKIDGSFIRDLGRVPQTTELVRIMVEIGQVLTLDVVAECVETTDQADRLRAMGCEHAQGWLYSKALPGPEAGEVLAQAVL